MNYNKLTAMNPYIFIEFQNSIGQKIKIVEHPILGDESPMIAVCEELQIAAKTDFFEIGEIDQFGGEYEGGFVDGKLVHGLN